MQASGFVINNINKNKFVVALSTFCDTLVKMLFSLILAK